MSVLIRFAPPGTTTTEQYDELIRRLQDAGHFPPDGLDYHVCFLADGNVRVSEIWESQEKFEAFGETLRPKLQDAGIQLSGEPEFFDVHVVDRF